MLNAHGRVINIWIFVYIYIYTREVTVPYCTIPQTTPWRFLEMDAKIL